MSVMTGLFSGLLRLRKFVAHSQKRPLLSSALPHRHGFLTNSGHIEPRATNLNFLSGFVPRQVFSNEDTMTDSQQLLAAYVSGSEAAFRELVSRYVKDRKSVV